MRPQEALAEAGIAAPPARTRRQRIVRRVAHLAVACAMSSWMLLPAMPIAAALIWLRG
jgi:hypothetical protein